MNYFTTLSRTLQDAIAYSKHIQVQHLGYKCAALEFQLELDRMFAKTRQLEAKVNAEKKRQRLIRQEQIAGLGNEFNDLVQAFQNNRLQ